jgi:hypothetical protein
VCLIALEADTTSFYEMEQCPFDRIEPTSGAPFEFMNDRQRVTRTAIAYHPTPWA